MKKRLLSCMAALALGTMVLAGCTPQAAASAEAEAGTAAVTDTKPADTKKGGVKISVVGSTTVAEPMEKLVAKYKELGNQDNIEVQGVGSSAGIKAAIEDTADIGMSSRELKAEEKEGVVETVIAYDGIAVVVHPSNDVSDLTKSQIKDIFEGTITNWKEVGGADQGIVVVTREAGSGTRGAFEEILKLIDENKASTIADIAVVAEGTGSVMAQVASKEYSIGFVSEGFLNDTVKPVKVDGVECTVDNVKAGSYTISRPLLLITKPDLIGEAQALIDFVLGDVAQGIMSENYISVKN